MGVVSCRNDRTRGRPVRRNDSVSGLMYSERRARGQPTGAGSPARTHGGYVLGCGIGRYAEGRMELVHSGKVRDVYEDGGDLILVASDRVSVYDVVLPTPIPGKGAILTQLSLWWFDRLADVVPNHVISE